MAELVENAIHHHRKGDIQQAKTIYKRILSEEPDQPDALHGLGMIAYQLKEYDSAINLTEKAIRNRPSIPQFHYNLGIIFIAIKNQERAIRAFKNAVELNPFYPEAYYNLGLALKEQNRFEEAVSNFKQAVNLNPDDADGYYNLGNSYEALKQYEAAVSSYQTAIKMRPDFAAAYNNLALILKTMGRIDEAIRHFREAIRLQPDNAEGHWNLSLTLLLSGRFLEGWKGYEWRFRKKKRDTVYPYQFKIPPWDGSPFIGKRLFVHSEQGLGDTLQFIRYLPLVKNLGGTVIFETYPPLIAILKNFPGIDELLVMSSDRSHVENCDCYIPIMSLPMLFKTEVETIPLDVPYIFSDPLQTTKWREKICENGYKIGITWAGKPGQGNDNKSCGLSHFLNLAGIPEIKLYGLQKGDGTHRTQPSNDPKDIIYFDRELKDFSETAAAIENLDLIISVDTAVAHLAGAMGKPVWTLLPFAPDWRWLLGRRDSPWYPTMRLYRQPGPGDWDSVFNEMRGELEKSLNKVGHPEWKNC